MNDTWIDKIKYMLYDERKIKVAKIAEDFDMKNYFPKPPPGKVYVTKHKLCGKFELVDKDIEKR